MAPLNTPSSAYSPHNMSISLHVVGTQEDFSFKNLYIIFLIHLLNP